VLKVVFIEVALRELVEVAAVLELVQVYSPEPFSQGGRHWEKYILYLLQTCGGKDTALALPRRLPRGTIIEEL
jgi:hypothetical protein